MVAGIVSWEKLRPKPITESRESRPEGKAVSDEILDFIQHHHRQATGLVQFHDERAIPLPVPFWGGKRLWAGHNEGDSSTFSGWREGKEMATDAGGSSEGTVLVEVDGSDGPPGITKGRPCFYFRNDVVGETKEGRYDEDDAAQHGADGLEDRTLSTSGSLDAKELGTVALAGLLAGGGSCRVQKMRRATDLKRVG